jgi:small-conductance mechanosensitive channel
MNFQIVLDSLTKIATDIVNFIPNLINGLIILFIGYLVSMLVRWIINFVLRRVKFDALIERTGITGGLRMFGIETPLSAIFSQAVFVLLLLSFLITSTRIMGLEPVAQLFERLLTFVPTLLAALIFFLLGALAAQFLGNTATAVATTAGLTSPSRVGQLVQFLIIVFVVILSLGIMGLDTALLVTTVTIMIAAFGLALGLALGLGAKRVVQHVLAGYYLKQRFRTGQSVTVDEFGGKVVGIGGVNTVIGTSEGSIVVPNETMLESVVATTDDHAGPGSGPSSS